jgi:hypothetical protein
MALYTFIVYMFLILLLFLISAIIRSNAEDEKWVGFLKEVAIQTKLEFIRNNGSAYPFFAGKYFERSIKLELINIRGYEGVLPRMGLRITIELKNTAPNSLIIKRRVYCYQ